MAVGVRIEIEFKNKKNFTSALANSGYETDENEILVPLPFAKEKLKETKGRKVKYRGPAGEVEFTVLPKANVKVITKDKESKTVEAKLVLSPFEDEVLLNDKLIQGVGIVFMEVKPKFDSKFEKP